MSPRALAELRLSSNRLRSMGDVGRLPKGTMAAAARQRRPESMNHRATTRATQRQYRSRQILWFDGLPQM